MTANVVHPADLERILQARVAAARQRSATEARERNRRSSRGRPRRGASLGFAVLATMLLAIGTVFAVHENPAFELDGNTSNDLTAGEDWNDVFADTDTGVASDFQHDEAEPDSSHHEPSNADEQGVEDWGCVEKMNVNNKEDIRHAYAAAYDIGGDQHLFFGADRDSNNGSANIGVWFFQTPVDCQLGPEGEDGQFTGHKTDGDLFIVSEFTNGGRVAEILIYIWTDPDGIPENGDECIGDGVDCSAAHAGDDHPFASGIDCQVTDPHANPGSPNVCATVNTDGDNKADEADQVIDVPWEDAANDPEEADFFEGGLNLSELFPSGIDCFTDVMIETRSSFSITANLFDIVFLNFDTCGSTTGVKYLDVNGNGADDDEPRLEGWTINLYEDDNGNGDIDAGDDLVATADTDADGEVFFDGLDAGDYIACEVLEVDTPAWVNTDPGGGSLCESVEVTISGDAVVDFGNGQPSIDVTKSVDLEDVCAGTEVTYTITVTNDGNVTLTNVDVVDDKLGDIALDLTLEPGDSETYNPTATPAADVTNVVSVSGEWGGLTPAASDTASASVDVHDCSIDVTKDPDVDEVCIGADTLVTYTYHVINDGDVELTNVTVSDNTIAGAQAAFELENGNSDTLAVGADIEFTLTATINATTTNTVDVAGDALGQTPAATDSAEATVTAIPCGEGCTPGFWQGGLGAELWDEADDPDWGDAGGVGTNPFDHDTLFNSFFTPHSALNGMSMLDAVGTGGGNTWARKAARDVVAAYLNASFGLDYEFTVTEIEQMWTDAVNAGGTAGFRAIHADLGAANEDGCSIGSTITTTTNAVGVVPIAGLAAIGMAVRRRRTR